ncbi:MAG TPA: alkaline phosphatase family protein, partial [Planctomycetota bacterium]|nr:alkaline phosphatase family protein [Planctomycetota bacterium]
MTDSFRCLRARATLLCLAAFLSTANAATAPQAGASTGRVIVLGFDGADARTTAELMDKGQLPNCAALREKGTFAPLDTTNPAESPVSWAALNCGQNPAKTGVPGFIRRMLIGMGPQGSGPKNPSPDLGHLVGPRDVPIESMSGTPIPTWSPNELGAATVALFLAVFLLLRMRAALAIGLSLILGIASFVGGRALRGYLPSRIPAYQNPLAAVPFWETAGKAGVKCVVLDAAQSFDRTPAPNARVLAGLGVPDARGSINSFFLYSTSEDYLTRAAEGGKSTDSSGLVFRIDEHRGRVDSLLPGPVNFWEIDKLRSEKRAIEHQYD